VIGITHGRFDDFVSYGRAELRQMALGLEGVECRAK
jgi:hypothetical protein